MQEVLSVELFELEIILSTNLLILSLSSTGDPEKLFVLKETLWILGLIGVGLKISYEEALLLPKVEYCKLLAESWLWTGAYWVPYWLPRLKGYCFYMLLDVKGHYSGCYAAWL